MSDGAETERGEMTTGELAPTSPVPPRSVSAVLASLRQLAEAEARLKVREQSPNRYTRAFDPPTVLALIAVAEAARKLADWRVGDDSVADMRDLCAALVVLAAVRGVS